MNHSCFLLVLVLLTAMAWPAAATLVQTSVSFTPDPPLVPGSDQHMVGEYAIIPSGATTFARGHELQMQTGLLGARWSIQVTLDGRNAAYQTAKGSAAFLNGELLSYSTNHDVGMIVTVDGTIPQDAGTPFTVLRIEEIDDSGGVVPGSVLTISQPVAGEGTAGSPVAVPTLTPPLVTTATLPMKAAGFCAGAGIIALLVIGLLVMCFRK